MGISQIQGEYQTSDSTKCAVSPSQSGVNLCTGSCMRSATQCSDALLYWLILLTVWDETLGLRLVFGLLLRISTVRK